MTTEEILQLLRSPSSEARKKGVEQAVEHGLLIFLEEALRDPVEEVRAAALEAIRDKLAYGSLETRIEAAVILAGAGPAAAPAVMDLRAILWDEDLILRSWAVQALKAIGPAAVPALMDALRCPFEDVRADAALALGELGAAEAAPALVFALTDFSDRVHYAAHNALALLGEAAIPALLKAMEKGLAPALRAAAVKALVRLRWHDPRAKAALRAVLHDEDEAVRYYAQLALEELEPGGREEVAA